MHKEFDLREYLDEKFAHIDSRFETYGQSI